MPKFLMEAKFSPQGLTGVLREGGTARREVVRKAVESAGGKLESFNFAFGEHDTFSILDLPDNESAAAISLSISASGAVMTRMVVLLTPEEIDAATKRTVAYRAPGL